MSKWIRLTDQKGIACPVCGQKHGCMLSTDDSVAICMRVEDGCVKRRDGTAVAAANGMGWLHRLNGKKTGLAAQKLSTAKERPRLKMADVAAMIKQHRATLSDKRLSALSASLKVSTRSLLAVGVGYDLDRGAYSFPMYDGKRNPVGIRLRHLDGRKLCVPGSRTGLFIPDHFDPQPVPAITESEYPLVLLLPEGPTDVAASLDLGFMAIGRPSNIGGADDLVTLLSSRCKQEVVIVADRDKPKTRPDGESFWPGIEGALFVAKMIARSCGQLRFLMAPEGAKDLRDWVSMGNHNELLYLVSHSPPVTPSWLKAAYHRLVEMKQAEKQKPAA